MDGVDTVWWDGVRERNKVEVADHTRIYVISVWGTLASISVRALSRYAKVAGLTHQPVNA